MTTLNLGSGNDTYGDVRVDLYRHAPTTVLADVDHGLPFRDGSFDEVYSRSFFEHLRNPFAGLVEMRRICKPGGRIVVITDNAGYPTHYIPRLYGDHVGTYTATANGPRDRHYAIFTTDHLRNLANAARLEIVDLGFVSGARGDSALTRVLRRIPLLDQMAYPWLRMVARKPVRPERQA